jgi:hypothetical protein
MYKNVGHSKIFFVVCSGEIFWHWAVLNYIQCVLSEVFHFAIHLDSTNIRGWMYLKQRIKKLWLLIWGGLFVSIEPTRWINLTFQGLCFH